MSRRTEAEVVLLLSVARAPIRCCGAPCGIHDSGRTASDDEWDHYVAEKTAFKSWDEMQEKALAEWTARKLGL